MLSGSLQISRFISFSPVSLRSKIWTIGFNEIKNVVFRMLDEKNIQKDEVGAIGMGMPGCIDSVNGIATDLTNLPKWGTVHVTEGIEKVLDIPSYLDNDVNLMTIGELVCGAGKGCDNLICVTLGTGVGGGVVIDGKLYRGKNLSAGEIGHMTLFPEGVPCNCGNTGCLERYVGNSDIVRRTKQMLEDNPQDGKILIDMIDGKIDRLTPKIISEAAYKNDPLSKNIWYQTGYYIGVTFAGVVNLLNPERFVIGGGVAQAGEILFEPIRETINKLAMKTATKNLKIVPAELGESAGIYGSGIYGIKHEFHEVKKL